MAITLQVTAIATAIFGFGCLLTGHYPLALGMLALFTCLELLWKRAAR